MRGVLDEQFKQFTVSSEHMTSVHMIYLCICSLQKNKGVELFYSFAVGIVFLL